MVVYTTYHKGGIYHILTTYYYNYNHIIIHHNNHESPMSLGISLYLSHYLSQSTLVFVQLNERREEKRVTLHHKHPTTPTQFSSRISKECGPCIYYYDYGMMILIMIIIIMVWWYVVYHLSTTFVVSHIPHTTYHLECYLFSRD